MLTARDWASVLIATLAGILAGIVLDVIRERNRK